MNTPPRCPTTHRVRDVIRWLWSPRWSLFLRVSPLVLDPDETSDNSYKSDIFPTLAERLNIHSPIPEISPDSIPYYLFIAISRMLGTCNIQGKTLAPGPMPTGLLILPQHRHVWGKASSVEGSQPERGAPPEKKKKRYANKKAMKTRRGGIRGPSILT